MEKQAGSRWTTFVTIVGLLVFLGSTILFSGYLPRIITDIRSRASIDGTSADVIVVGAGSGGVSAALQAARSGATVILLEETDWVGGQMTAAGVSTMDGGQAGWNGGIYKEFIDNVRSVYQTKGKSLNTCYFYLGNTCFEPNVGKRILEEMIGKQPTISLRLRSQVLSVQKNGNTVTGLLVRQNGSTKTLTSKVVIDATEYGDLLPLAGVPYRAGNGISSSLSDTACIQDITYTAIIKKYPGGVPESLKITSPPPGYTDEVKAEFAKIVTKTGSNVFGTYPVNWNVHTAYRGVPDSGNPGNYDSANPAAITKTGVNWANDFPVTVKYIEDKAYRKEINCQAKLKTMQFLYYAQTALGENNWSVATDEGYDTPYNREENSCAIIPNSLKTIERNMPVMPYVREGRRVIGLMTLSGRDIKRTGTPRKSATTYATSLAVGDYPSDLHGCNWDSTFELSLESSEDWPHGWADGPFQIPFEAFIPKDIDGLLVAEKNLSQSRLANGATRLQPVTMLTGQAAGAIAALSVRLSVSPRRVPVRRIQDLLTDAKASIVPFADVSASDPTFSDTQQIAARGIMLGYGNLTFGPNDQLQRNQVAVVISRTFGIPQQQTDTQTFTDVPKTDPFFPYIEGLYKSGLTGGCNTNPMKYCPNDPATNAQLAVFALRGWQRLDPPINPLTPSSPTYTDVPATHWAYPYIEGLATRGIRWYCDEPGRTFCPDSPALRKHTAVAIAGILNRLDESVLLPTSTPLPQSVQSALQPTATTQPIPTTAPNHPANTPTQTPAASSPTLSADLNGDGKITIVDYTLFMNYWLKDDVTKIDFNQDGKVSVIDYTLFMNEWNKENKN